MGPYGPIWAHMGPYEPKGSHMDTFGPIWVHIRPMWTHMRPYGRKWNARSVAAGHVPNRGCLRYLDPLTRKHIDKHHTHNKQYIYIHVFQFRSNFAQAILAHV